MMATIEGTTVLEERPAGRLRRSSRRMSKFVRAKPLGALGMLVILVVITAAVAAPVLAIQDPLAQEPADRLAAPSSEHWFGTDDLGRDVLSRVIWGARISLWVGIIAVGIGVVAGTLLGIVSGYFGGKIDLLSQRLLDMVMAFPALILAMVITAVLGTSITNVMIAIGVVIVPNVARVVRPATLSTREQQYIEAAASLGASHLRIVAVHVFPNIVAPIIVLATAVLGNAILTEAALSFLGLGTPPPHPSWGGMLSGSSRLYLEIAPWLAIFPGLAITVTVLGFNLLGDALRDVLDPRLRGGR